MMRKGRSCTCCAVIWFAALLALFVTVSVAQAQDGSGSPDTCVRQPGGDDSGDTDPAPCAVDAQGGVPPWVEYRKRIEPTQRIAPLAQGFAGEKLSLYNGATTFSVTDIDIPGNSKLPVRLVRRLAIALQPQDQIQPYDTRLLGAGNWDVDVPYIAATYPTELGWPAHLCSVGSVPPLVMGPNGRFRRGEVWQGLTIHLPGRGDTSALGLDASVPVPANGVSYRLTTRNRDVLSCIPMQSGLPGEGFRLTTTDGVQYDFDVAVTRTASKLVKRIFVNNDGTKLEPVYLERTRYILLASTITDRFGNTVQISYNAAGHPTDIVASDGREITLAYAGGRLQSATGAGRTWAYAYTEGKLHTVTLPDTRQWTYTYLGTLKPPTPPPFESLSTPWCQGTPAIIVNSFTFTATHPSGASASFEFDNQRHNRSGVHASTCIQYGQGLNAIYELTVPYYFDVMSLTHKEISGPGLPTATWDYAYGATAHGLWGQHDAQANYPCTTCTQYKTVTATRPDGSQKFERYGIVYRLNDGRLLQTQILNANGQVARTTIHTYLAEDAVAAQPFYGAYGHILGGVSDPVTARIRPVVETTLSQDGTTWTTAVDTFDSYARATEQTQSNTTGAIPGARRTVKTDYHDDPDLWVLGQVAKSTVGGIVASETTYDSTTAQPLDSYRFGRLDWSRVWNSDGTLHSLTDGNGHSTTFTSWQRGTPQQVQFADLSTASAVVNDAGWVTSITDERNHITGYQYDPVGRLTRITASADSGQAWLNTELDFTQSTASEHGLAAGHWTRVVHTGANKTVTYYDGLWRPVLTEHFDSADKAGTLSQVATHYDAMGREVFRSWPSDSIGDFALANSGNHTHYDALGRVTSVQRNSELGLLTTTTDYLADNTVKVTDPKGHSTTTTYQAFGQPTHKKTLDAVFAQGTAQQTSTAVTRDDFGKPLSMSQSGDYAGYPARSVSHSFVYDSHQRRCKRIDPESGQTAFGYDAAGNLIWSAQGVNGIASQCSGKDDSTVAPKRVDRVYDLRNRLLTIDYPANEPDTSFTYYPDGKVDTATRGSATWTSTWFDRGLLKTDTLSIDSHSFALGYSYNPMGQLETETWPATLSNPGTPSLSIDYAPNALGQPTQIGIYAESIDYAPNGQLTDLSYGNGVDYHATFTTRNLLDTVKYQRGTALLANRGFDWDKSGNPLSVTDSITLPPDTIFRSGFEFPQPLGTDDRSYQYDALDRLTDATIGHYGTRHYRYGPLGNLRARSGDGGTITFDYEPPVGTPNHNRLESDSVHGAWSYDERGNVNAVDGFTMVYNHANEVTSNNAGASFEYDARGWRVKKTTPGHTRYFVYDANHHLVARLDNGALTNFIHLGNRPIARIENGVVTYIQTDYQNTPLSETDAAGQVIRRPHYAAYGVTGLDGVAEIPGYAGSAPDATGLNYMGARYYHPASARFLAPDPATLNPLSPTGLNRYVYASDSPARYTDSFGKQPWEHHPPPKPPLRVQIKRGATNFVAQVAHDAATIAGMHPNASLGQRLGALARTAATFSPLALESGAARTAVTMDRAVGVTSREAATGARTVVKEGTAVFRAFGGEASGMGRSWTTVNPSNVTNYRTAAGLFPGNSGQFLVEGRLTNSEGVLFRNALPGPNGVGGGLPELVVPNPPSQICVVCVSGVNPAF